MNVQMAYLLGMITGNGEIQRGTNDTTVVIEIPHKKLETEFYKDAALYVKASITDIREVIEPLIGTGIRFSQSKNVSDISFTKPNEDYLIREILQFIGNGTSHVNMSISPDVYNFTKDERVAFIRGFADVTGYIRRSNAYYEKTEHRVYFEIPQNWQLVADFCNLLKSVDIPVQNIDWGHPNTRVTHIKNEITDLIDAVAKRHKILQLPIISGKYLRKVSHRERLQDPDNMKSFAESKDITTFSSLQGYIDEHGARFDELTAMLSKGEGDIEQIKKELIRETKGLAFAEVLDYNKDNEARERGADKRAKERKHRKMLQREQSHER